MMRVWFENPAIVVGDFGATAMLITQALRVLGFGAVDHAYDVKTALHRLRSKPYSLVLSDIHTKPIGGFAFLRQMRKDFALPFIFVSGEKSTSFVQRARKAGAAGFVLKSFGPQEMIQSIDHILTATSDHEFCVPSGLPRLRSAESIIFGSECEPMH